MDEARKQLRLKRINDKGLGVATRLSELLAGKDVDLGAIGLSGPELVDDKEMRLRGFLDQINAARQRLLSGAYGVCLACGAPFPDAALDEMPWIERCSDCVAEDRPVEEDARWPQGRPGGRR